MKSEHRHELQTNELGKAVEKLGVFLDVHGNRLMIGVCAVCLVAAGLIYWTRTRSAGEAAAWRELSSANKPEDYYDVWQAHKNSPPGLWARVHEGETRLGLGVQAMFRNVETGTEELKKARAAFQAVADNHQAPDEIRERALIGLGHALESLSDGSEADALKAYETLVTDYPKSIYKAEAEERKAALSRGSGQEFYAWFAKYPRPKTPEKGPHDKGSSDTGDSAEDADDILEKFNALPKSKEKKSVDGDTEESMPDEAGDSEKEKPEGDAAADTKEKPAKPADEEGSKSESKPDSEEKPKPEKSE